LERGVKKYIAIDINNLASSVSAEIYNKLSTIIKEKPPMFTINYTKELQSKATRIIDSRINYIVDKEFDITKINEKVDIVFSQAAFEHFDDVKKLSTNK